MTARARGGATAIEFALILPVFVALLSGIIDGGWLFWQQSSLDLSVHDGCRSGSLRDPGIGNADIAAVQAVAATAIQDNMNAHGTACTVCDINVTMVTTGTEDALQCVADWEWSPVIGIIPAYEMRSAITMRLEMQR